VATGLALGLTVYYRYDLRRYVTSQYRKNNTSYAVFSYTKQ